MKTLSQGPEAFSQLLGSLQKARSIAAEGGYLDLLAADPHAGTRGLDPFVGDDRTVVLLNDLATGARVCNNELWMNIAFIVDQSPPWQMTLAARGYEMPTVADVLHIPAQPA